MVILQNEVIWDEASLLAVVYVLTKAPSTDLIGEDSSPI